MKILHQHDKIDALEDKINLFKIDNKALNTRIESIENWLLKQDKNLKEAKENISTLKSNIDEFKNLQDKVAFLEKDNLKVQVEATPTINPRKCDQCDKVFLKNCDLEKHLLEHEQMKEFACKICEFFLLLKWRMMKHQQMHTETPTFCYYFNSNIDCPFAEIGCKFLHEKAGKCKSLQCVRKMCP